MNNLNSNCSKLYKEIYNVNHKQKLISLNDYEVYLNINNDNKNNLKNYLKDPFFDKSIEEFKKWYENINKEYKGIPEYKYLIAGFIKDVNEDNKNNQNKKNHLLKILEDTIKSNYLYFNVIKSIKEYLLFFNKNEVCDLTLLDKLELSPYIIFPSFHKLDFYQLNLIMTVPIINFHITKNIIEIEFYEEKTYWRGCNQLSDRWNFLFFNPMINFFKKLKNINDDKKIFDFINNNPKIFKEYFKFTSTIIDKLVLFRFSKNKLKFKNNKNENLVEEQENYINCINCILLFMIFFQNNFYDKIDYVLNESNNNSLSEYLMKYFKDNFKEKCYSCIDTDDYFLLIYNYLKVDTEDNIIKIKYLFINCIDNINKKVQEL